MVGIELTPTAVAAATKAAQDRGLTNATFVQDDITSFTGLRRPLQHGRRQHAVPLVAGRRSRRLPAIRAPGGRTRRDATTSWCSPTAAFPAETDFGPKTVTEDELREAVSKHWEIDEIRPAFIHANMRRRPSTRRTVRDADLREATRRAARMMPAYLLTAHKAAARPWRSLRPALRRTARGPRRCCPRAATPAAPVSASRTAHAASRRRW